MIFVSVNRKEAHPMETEEIARIDRITAALHYLLKGSVEDPIDCHNDPDDEIRQLTEKVNILLHNFKEIQDFIVPLSQGILDVRLPKKNILASPFKQLHASLSHLTWQTQRIAQGDLNQRVDFMGDFSVAFNSMVDSLREARSQLISEIEQFKKLAELKNHYLNVMAHDIRTPIGAIIGFTDILLDSRLSPEQIKHTEIIKRNSESLLSLINNVLDMAKLEKNKMELDSVPFSLITLGEDIGSMILPKLKPGVQFIFDHPEDLPESVIGDPNRLRQILTNLIGNAAKFTENGNITLTITHSEQPDERTAFVFKVKDDGIGIAEDKLKTIFSPFSQADGSIASKFGGTGLGLAIAQELIHLMGGELEVESRLGKGSVFYFTIPLDIHQEAESLGLPEPCLKRIHILVVDDDPHALNIISDTLKKQNVRFELCHDSTRAYRMMANAYEQKDPFTLAWLDIDMPGLNGFELAEIIRADKRFKRVRLVACSAYMDKIGRDNGPSHFSFVASKPISQQALRRILEEASYDYSESDEVCHLAGLQMLVVDDNPLNRMLVRNIMTKLDVEITEAENGLDGVDKVKEKEFDIVLMDRMMPVMDGIEAIKRIRETFDPESLPILAFSAGDTDEDKESFISAGVNGFISKPIIHDAIVEKLCEAIKR